MDINAMYANELIEKLDITRCVECGMCTANRFI